MEETKLSGKMSNILSTIKEESMCSCDDVTKHSTSQDDGCHDNSLEPPVKRQKHEENITDVVPQFYYNIHRRRFKEVNLPK